MATALPPPNKRQRREFAEAAREQLEVKPAPSDLGSVRIQFVDDESGESRGSSIVVPLAHSSIKDLETIVNAQEKRQLADRVPYRFTFVASKTGHTTTISSDLQKDVIAPGLGNIESTLTIRTSPQAVFRVRAVSRLSSAISGHSAAILAAQFSPATSSRLVTGGGGGKGQKNAQIWDVETSTPFRALAGHISNVLSVCYSPDGSIIATGDQEGRIGLYTKDGEAMPGTPFKSHSKYITTLCFEPFHLQARGRPRLASSSKDATVRICDVVSKRIDMVLSGHKGCVTCVRWGGTGKIYTSSHDHTIKIWRASDGVLETTLNSGHSHWVNHITLSTDFVLRTAYFDHTRDEPVAEEDKVEKARLRYEKAARDGERLVSASEDMKIALWNPSKSERNIFKPGHKHQAPVNHVSFSPDSRLIASAGYDNHINLWDGRTGTHRLRLRGHVQAVYMTSWSPDSRLLVSASADTTCKVWDVEKGELKEDLVGGKDQMFAVDWAPDGQKVASGGADKLVRIWRH